MDQLHELYDDWLGGSLGQYARPAPVSIIDGNMDTADLLMQARSIIRNVNANRFNI